MTGRKRSPSAQSTSPKTSKRKSSRNVHNVSTIVETNSYQSTKPKRARLPPDQFDLLAFTSQNYSNEKSPTVKKVAKFAVNDFVTVRSDDSQFYLCQLQANVYEDSNRSVKIRWLELEKNPNLYTWSFVDKLDPTTILTNVAVSKLSKDKFSLPNEEIMRTIYVLRKSIQSENGQKVLLEDAPPPSFSKDFKEEVKPKSKVKKSVNKEADDKDIELDNDNEEADDEIVDDDNDSNFEDSETVSSKRHSKTAESDDDYLPGNQKKRKKSTSKSAVSNKPPPKSTSRSPRLSSKTAKVKQTAKSTISIQIEKINSFFDPLYEPPRCSPQFNNRLLIRAVVLNDLDMLKSLILDKSLSSLTQAHSKDVHINAIMYSVLLNRFQHFKLLYKEIKGEGTVVDRATNTASHLSVMSTGSTFLPSNFLGFRRQVAQSRSGKEGNMALNVEELNIGFDLEYIGRHAVNKEYLEFVISQDPEIYVFNAFIEAVTSGNVEIASYIAGIENFKIQCGLNVLFKESMTSQKSSELSTLSAPSIKKKCHLHGITPMHCATLNPSSEVLIKFLDIVPMYNIADRRGYQLIHYASVSKYTSALKFLLNKKVSLDVTANNGYTPFMIAAKHGRTKNLEMLLNYSPALVYRCVNYKTRFGITALHLAVLGNHVDCIKLLCKYIDAPIPSKGELGSPLDIACKHGYFEAAETLLNVNYKVDGLDKLKRTPIMHAAMNGHCNIMTLLLANGANIDAGDSSLNTASHYAAAYGWINCLKLLIDEGASLNCGNNWSLTPLMAAILKGYLQCADLLLDVPVVDVNYQDSKGKSILHHLCTGKDAVDSSTKIKFLIIEKKCKVDVLDSDGNTPLHHLSMIDFSHCTTETERSIKQQVVVDLAKLLVEHGCSSNVNMSKKSPCVLALESKNSILLKYLINSDIGLEKSNINTEFFMSLFANSEFNDSCLLASSAIEKLADDELSDILNKLIDGKTPIHVLFKVAQECNNSTFMNNIIKILDLLVSKNVANFNMMIQKTCDNEFGESVITNVEAPIHIAVQAQPEVGTLFLHRFLLAKPLLDVYDSDGFTPLHLILKNKSVDLQKLGLLLHAGVDFNKVSRNEINVNGNKVVECATPIIIACKAGCTEAVQMLLNVGVNTACHDASLQRTALHYAIDSLKSTNCITILQMLIPRFNPALITTKDIDGRSALHLACMLTSDIAVDAIELLVASRAEMSTDKDMCTPLHLMFKSRDNNFSGYDPISLFYSLKGVLDVHAVNAYDSFGYNPFHYAASRGASNCCNEMLAIDTRLVDLKTHDGNTALNLAVLYKHYYCTQILLNRGASVNETVKPIVSKGEEITYDLVDGIQIEPDYYNVITHLAKANWSDLTYMLLKTDGANVPIIQIISSLITGGCLTQASRLIRNISNHQIIQLNSHSQNLLHVIALCNVRDSQIPILVSSLLSRGVNLLHKDDYSALPLHYAAFTGNLLLVKELIKLHNGKVDNCDNSDRSILSAAVMSGDYDTVAYIFDYVSPKLDALVNFPIANSLNSINDNFYKVYTEAPLDVPCTVLIFAIKRKLYNIVRFLLKKGASVNICDYERTTPAMHAVISNDIATLALTLNPDIDFDKEYSLIYKTAFGNEITDSLRLSNYYNHNLTSTTVINPTKCSSEDNDDDEHSHYESIGSEAEVEDVPTILRKTSSIKNYLPPFTLSNNVDLMMQDKDGNTAMHHLVTPRLFGFTQNELMFSLLVSCGAKVMVTNSRNQSPYDLAVVNNCSRIASKMEPLITEITEYPSFPIPEHSLDCLDMGTFGKMPITFENDSKLFMESLQNKLSLQRLDYVPTVMPECIFSSDSVVEFDNASNVYLDSLLLKGNVDTRQTLSGVFYHMQLTYCKGNGMYVLVTYWGSVGYSGQCQNTPFRDRGEAFAEFTKIFKAKTGNDWSQQKSFTLKPKKYNLVKTEFRHRIKISSNMNLNEMLASNLKPSVPFEISKLMQKLFNSKSLSESFNNENQSIVGHRGNKFFVNSVSQSSIDDSYKLLDQLKAKLEEVEAEKKKPSLNVEAVIECYSDMLELSIKLLYTLPVQPDYMTNQFVHDRQTFNNMFRCIRSLEEMKFTTKLIFGALQQISSCNPWDYLYHNMNCFIKFCPPQEKISQLILKYISKTADISKVRAIYRLDRPGEKEAISACGVNDNHCMLWHGTNLNNVASILGQGLLPAPYEIAHGNFHGNDGIFFSDVFTQSLDYANSRTSNRFLFLCQVALGRMHEFTSNTSLPSNVDSLFVPGGQRVDPKGTIILPGGVKVPLGNPERAEFSWRPYSHYVIFNKQQCRLCYLVQYEW